MQSCIMVCLAVSSAFGFQGRNSVDEDRKALELDVMLIVVVRINVMGHVLRRPAFSTPDALVVLSSRYAAVCFGNDIGFRPLIMRCTKVVCLSFVKKILLANVVGHDSSDAVCVECPVK